MTNNTWCSPKGSTQKEAERTSQSLKTMTKENNLSSTSKQPDVKPIKKLETEAVQTNSPSMCFSK